MLSKAVSILRESVLNKRELTLQDLLDIDNTQHSHSDRVKLYMEFADQLKEYVKESGAEIEPQFKPIVGINCRDYFLGAAHTCARKGFYDIKDLAYLLRFSDHYARGFFLQGLMISLRNAKL